MDDDDCEEETGRLGALSSASTPDISAKEEGEYDLVWISGLDPFHSPCFDDEASESRIPNQLSTV